MCLDMSVVVLAAVRCAPRRGGEEEYRHDLARALDAPSAMPMQMQRFSHALENKKVRAQHQKHFQVETDARIRMHVRISNAALWRVGIAHVYRHGGISVGASFDGLEDSFF